MRSLGEWDKIYSKIKKLKPYDGIYELISLLIDNNIKLSIVTNSPSIYCNKIITESNIKIRNVVCYHDVKYNKPHEEPMIKAMQLMNTSKNHTISIGDEVNDIVASKNAGIHSIVAAWDPNDDIRSLKFSKPNEICYNVDELIKYLTKVLNLKSM